MDPCTKCVSVFEVFRKSFSWIDWSESELSLHHVDFLKSKKILIVWRLFSFSLSLSLLPVTDPINPTGLQSFSSSMNTSPVIGLKNKTKNSSCHLTPLLQSHGSSCLSWPIPCRFCPVFFSPSPLTLLPGLWKANEESWAEGSFCVLVKKNNLCQRKVLQQLCCRTCSLKGWRDVLAGYWRGVRGV